MGARGQRDRQSWGQGWGEAEAAPLPPPVILLLSHLHVSRHFCSHCCLGLLLASSASLSDMWARSFSSPPAACGSAAGTWPAEPRPPCCWVELQALPGHSPPGGPLPRGQGRLPWVSSLLSASWALILFSVAAEKTCSFR